MFQKRSYEKELMDDLNLANEDLRRNLDELEIINYWLGGNKVVTNALQKLYKKGIFKEKETIKVADLGSGGGDLLRVMAKWFRKKKIKVQLVGIDANDFMINYANEKSKAFPEITFQKKDIFSKDFQAGEFDIVTCSLFCHHFRDEELIYLFEKLNKETQIATIINDLHRHWFAYHSIKWLTKFFSKSYLVKNDAPLSVWRAFLKSDLEDFLDKAKVANYQVKWFWAFRYQAIFGKAMAIA